MRMGLHDRPYWRDDYGSDAGGGFMRGMSLGMPKPGKVVKWLLIINIGVFIPQAILENSYKVPISEWLGATVADFWQVWRYVTFQFLHDPRSIWHIGLNMLGLYMFGAPLEQLWGARRFLRFYLSCGAAAGVLYVVVGAILGGSKWIPLIGASGGIFGILLACAVLLPGMKVIVFIFPMSIRLAAALIFGVMILSTVQSLSAGAYSGDFWSSVAHLGGAGMAAVWIWGLPKFRGAGESTTRRIKRGAWQRKVQQRRDEQAEIDRILDKIRLKGIASLTRKEKRTLKEATRRQQRQDRDISRL